MYVVTFLPFGMGHFPTYGWGQKLLGNGEKVGFFPVPGESTCVRPDQDARCNNARTTLIERRAVSEATQASKI
jgi:hypothetical protein